MTINIRIMQEQDLPNASIVFCDSFNSVGEKWNIDTAFNRLKQYFNENSCWIAELNSEIVGILTSKEDNVLDHKELYIDIIAVDPRHQKLGIGEKLLNTAEEYAKETGYNGVWLTASDELSSYNWYIKTGFIETNWKVLFKPTN